MDMLKYSIMVGIALVVVSIVVPMGLREVANANLTGVDASVATIFTIVLPVLAILGIALGFMPPELKSKVGL